MQPDEPRGSLLARREAKRLSRSADSAVERHFFRRIERLVPVRRFVIAWLLFFVLMCGCLVGQIRALGGQYQRLQPIPGGIYTEGILGDFTTANPLYASGDVDESVSKLVFASLLKYDDRNSLVGDLAKDWSRDESEKVYTVHLKPGLVWHDGEPLTSADVLFTYQTIQNPDALSVLNQSWKDIKVAAPDPQTVTFTLPSPLSAFPHQMTNGIIPEHSLKNVAPATLRSNTFNTLHPVGAGPFMWQKIEVSGDTPQNREARIALAPFKRYAGGEPKLSSFVVHAYHDAGRLEDSFKRREVIGANFTTLPDSVKDDESVKRTSLLLTAANMVFFRENTPVLGDINVRKALVQGANVPAIIDQLDYATHAVQGPLLVGQLAYDRTLVQPPFDRAAATAILDKAGWVLGPNGVRVKGNTPLTFSLQAADTPENKIVTEQLSADWKELGVRANMQLKPSDDIQRMVFGRDNQAEAPSYEALLYGISIGTDPDVFVYWDSSQNDARSNRLNLSHFSNKAADTSLEGGRTRSDPALRAAKYKPFLQAWQQDTPALGLYQPRYLYATHGNLYGLTPHVINSDIDRYNNVENWMIREAAVTQR